VADLGEGGMGVVYRARDTRLQRDVAIKLLPGGGVDDIDTRARLMREARTAASLNHPNICTVHEVGEADGVPFLAMELVEGETLWQAIGRGRLTPTRVCRIGRQLAEALEHAHAHGVIHRDLKSANVILAPGGHAKVLDFGIAVRSRAAAGAHNQTTQTPADRLAGTLACMAPELLQGTEPSVRSDIWALGVVLHQMVTGRLPFQRKTDSDLVAAILRDAPEALPPGTPPTLARIIERCLAKDPADRPARAGEVALALDVAEPRASTAGGGEAAGDAPVTASGNRVLMIAVLTLAVLGSAAYFLMVRPTSRDDGTPSRFVNPVQVTTAVGVEDYPAWSPDGRTIAFAADPSGQPGGPTWDIWVVQPGGGAPINRTADHAGQDLFPSWSPDGTQIAFHSARDGGGCYVMPALAGAPRRVAAASLNDPNPPQWSADGAELGCVNGDVNTVAIDVVSFQTGQVARRIPLPGNQQPSQRRSFVTWSPDGARVALVVSDGGISSDLNRLWVRHVPTGKETPLTEVGRKVTSPSWSADGLTLHYVANSGATMDLWAQRVAPDGTPAGAPRPLTSGIGMRSAAFSADGQRLAYSQGRKVANVWRFPLRLDRTSTWADVTPVTSDQAYIECVAVDRGGTKLVVSSDRAGSIDLWTLPASGGEMQRLTTDPGAEWCGDWSPDGETVAFYAFRTGNREVWTVPAIGGEWRQVTDNPGGVDMHPGWSADGLELMFLSVRDGGVGAWATPSSGSGGSGRWISTSFGSSRWSPLDRRIAAVEKGRLWVADDDGRGRRVPLSDHAAGAGLRWTPDGRQVIFSGDSNHPGIWAARADGTGGARKLLDITGRRGALGLYGTPSDGKYVYFSWDEDLGDIWMMNVE
jgi:Tol biopolymer transport system component